MIRRTGQLIAQLTNGPRAKSSIAGTGVRPRRLPFSLALVDA
jgi:hypothetical protein